TLHDYTEVDIRAGELDLREIDLTGNEIISLDGEWEFYPERFIMEEITELDKREREYISLPGGWNDVIDKGQATSYGYGSYRLRMYVDPGKEAFYSLHVPSVRSASEVFVN